MRSKTEELLRKLTLLPMQRHSMTASVQTDFRARAFQGPYPAIRPIMNGIAMERIKSLISEHFHGDTEEAAEFVRDILSEYADFTEKTQPHAVNDIAAMRSAADSMLALPDEVNDN